MNKMDKQNDVYISPIKMIEMSLKKKVAKKLSEIVLCTTQKIKLPLFRAQHIFTCFTKNNIEEIITNAIFYRVIGNLSIETRKYEVVELDTTLTFFNLETKKQEIKSFPKEKITRNTIYDWREEWTTRILNTGKSPKLIINSIQINTKGFITQDFDIDIEEENHKNNI